MADLEGSESLPAGPIQSVHIAAPFTDLMQGIEADSSSHMTSGNAEFLRMKAFTYPTTGVSPLNPDRKAPNGSSISPADFPADHAAPAEKAIPQPKLPPACVAGLRVLDLSSGSPRAASGSGSPSSGQLTPVSDSGGAGSAMSASKLLKKFDLYSGSPRTSSLPASPSQGSRAASRAKLSQDDFHSR